MLAKYKKCKGKETIYECTAKNWFKNFKSGDIFFKLKSKSRWTSDIDYVFKMLGRKGSFHLLLKLSDLWLSKDTICKLEKKKHTGALKDSLRNLCWLKNKYTFDRS